MILNLYKKLDLDVFPLVSPQPRENAIPEQLTENHMEIYKSQNRAVGDCTVITRIPMFMTY